MLTGYFRQLQAGGRPWALGLQHSIFVSDKLQVIFRDAGFPLPAVGTVNFSAWGPGLAVLIPQTNSGGMLTNTNTGLNTSIFLGCWGR